MGEGLDSHTARCSGLRRSNSKGNDPQRRFPHKCTSWRKSVFFFFYCTIHVSALCPSYIRGFPGGIVVKNLPADAGDARDAGLIPGSGRSAGEGNSNPLQYSCLGNSMDRGAWRLSLGSQESDTT